MADTARALDIGIATDGLTRGLAAWVSSQRHQDVPEATRHAVRLAILDTLGAALYGMDQPWTKSVRAWAAGSRPVEANLAATVWGEEAAILRSSDAALVNAVAAHAFELDDFHHKLHPGAVVVPAALAVGESRKVSGALFETAVAVGYEVMLRASLALDPSAARLRGWHLTGVCGPLGAAAAAAVLAGLDAETTAWALGLAGTQASGLFAFNADGAMSKRLHPGFAARAGIAAVELAEAGVTGPTAVLEAADGGYLRAFSDVVHPEHLSRGLGRIWHTENVSFKPHACCGSLHAYVDAAIALRNKLGGSPASDRGVTAGLAHVVDVQCGYDYAPGTELNAQMNARYCIAAGLVDGIVLPPQFAPEKLADPTIVSLAQRIDLQHDPALDDIYPEHYVGWVEIDGNERAYVLDPSGSVANPDREAGLKAKFHALMSDRMSAGASRLIEASVTDLTQGSAGSLISALSKNRATS